MIIILLQINGKFLPVLLVDLNQIMSSLSNSLILLLVWFFSFFKEIISQSCSCYRLQYDSMSYHYVLGVHFAVPCLVIRMLRSKELIYESCEGTLTCGQMQSKQTKWMGEPVLSPCYART